MQPATNKDATTSERTAIAVIGFNYIRLCKRHVETLTVATLYFSAFDANGRYFGLINVIA